jgi:RNA polymerase sigma-70 factor, ECF subfamily
MATPLNSASATELAALRAGDEQALKGIFQRYYASLLTHAYRITADKDAARDVVQDVFANLWQKRANLDVHTSLQAYLRRAVVNGAINYVKSRQRFLQETPDQWAQVPDDAHDTIAWKEQLEVQEAQVRAAIESLPEKCRLVFVLSRFEQMSHKEIAETLDISVKTIENQITKAMKMLREKLLIMDNG